MCGKARQSAHAYSGGVKRAWRRVGTARACVVCADVECRSLLRVDVVFFLDADDETGICGSGMSSRGGILTTAFDLAYQQFECEKKLAQTDEPPPPPVPAHAVKVVVRTNTAYFALPDRQMYMATFWAGGAKPLVRPVPPDWVRWLRKHYPFAWPER